MTRLTITKARGGYIIEEIDEDGPVVVTRLDHVLLHIANRLSGENYGISAVGDVIILTPTGAEKR